MRKPPPSKPSVISAIHPARRKNPAAWLLHCWLPLAVGWSLAKVMAHAFGVPFSLLGITLLLAGIGAAYTADRSIDPSSPPEPGMKHLLRVAALVFAAVTLWMTLRAAPSIRIGVFLLGATTLAYSRLKRLPLAKTIIIALAWTLGPAILPFAGTTNPLPWWKLDLIPSLLLLLAANGILCDLKDREHDNKEGVLTLPVLIGSRKTCLLATGLLGLSVTLSLSRHHPELAVTGIALAIAAQFPSLLEREIAGPLIADAILILPGILLQIGAV